MNARKHVEGRLRVARGRTGRLARLGLLLGLGAVLLASAPSEAQVGTAGSEDAPPATSLSVTSDPPGVVVKLVGEYEFVGTTPWRLFHPISGVYRVEASAPGYGTWSRTVLLGPTGIQDLHIKLPRKSRLAAAARSLVIPGWGQHYNESPAKRNLVWVAEAASLVALYVYWERYQDKVDQFDRVAELYRNSRNLDAIPLLRQELTLRSERADDAFDSVEKVQLVAIGIYGLAFLDAFLTGSDEAGSPLRSRAAMEQNGTAGPSLGWAAGVNGRESRLGLRLSF